MNACQRSTDNENTFVGLYVLMRDCQGRYSPDAPVSFNILYFVFLLCYHKHLTVLVTVQMLILVKHFPSDVFKVNLESQRKSSPCKFCIS